MLKQHKKHIILTTAITLLPLLVGVLLWSRLPDTIATHFDFYGNPNGYSSKAFAVLFIPLFVTGCHLLCTIATANDPRRQGIPDKVYRLILWICPVVSLLCGALTYLTALDIKLDITRIMLIFMGLLFIILGNYLPKCRRNATVGIKLPWTLYDDDNWNNTHRMTGVLWIIGGVVVLADAFLRLLPPWGLIVLLTVMAIAPMVYSFWYYKRHGQKEPND